MLFRAGVYLKFKTLQAVRKGAFYYFLKFRYGLKKPPNEKVSPYTSDWRRGSLTVEAALVVPLFLFGAATFLYLFFFLQIQTEVHRSLTDTGRKLAQEGYFWEETLELEGTTEEAAGTAYVLLQGKRQLSQYLEGRLASGILKNGVSGISFWGSNWDKDTSMVTLKASYQVVLSPYLSWFHPISVVQSCSVRVFAGFAGWGMGGENGTEEMVYITTYGTVYHRSLSCRHLKLSVQSVAPGELETLRNSGGGKYYPCEYCWEKGAVTAYITEDGTRCHTSLNCQGLVRGIRTVLFSEVGTMPPCSVCGG